MHLISKGPVTWVLVSVPLCPPPPSKKNQTWISLWITLKSCVFNWERNTGITVIILRYQSLQLWSKSKLVPFSQKNADRSTHLVTCKRALNNILFLITVLFLLGKTSPIFVVVRCQSQRIVQSICFMHRCFSKSIS